MSTPVRKVVITSFGGPEKIAVVDSTLPPPAPKHVQVKVLYSGFSGADINMRLGSYPMQRKAPLTPGYSFVGTVHANGPGSNKFAVGRVVACLSIYDGEATYTNQPEKYLVPVPAGIDLKVATALTLDWHTAWGMVTHGKSKGRISPGQKVFIHGMSGAVGFALMTLCKAAGAQVYGTAAARNHESLRGLGVHPFVYTNKEWVTAMQKLGGVQAAFDPLGFKSFTESYSILSPQGGIVYGYGGNLTSLNNTQPRSVYWPVAKFLALNLKLWSPKSTCLYFISRDRASFAPDLEELFAMARDGSIDVAIKRVFELDEVTIAHKEWTSLTGMGSVVVKIS